jgi:hypothetical protein
MFDKCRFSKSPDKLCAFSSDVYCGRGVIAKDKLTGKSKHINKLEEMTHCPLKDKK